MRIVLTSPTGRQWVYDDERNRLLDFAPHVLEALAHGPKNQGDLQEAVWGTSGRGNATLKTLFNSMARNGFIKIEQRGRAIWYSKA